MGQGMTPAITLLSPNLPASDRRNTHQVCIEENKARNETKHIPVNHPQPSGQFSLIYHPLLAASHTVIAHMWGIKAQKGTAYKVQVPLGNMHIHMLRGRKLAPGALCVPSDGTWIGGDGEETHSHAWMGSITVQCPVIADHPVIAIRPHPGTLTRQPAGQEHSVHIHTVHLFSASQAC